MSMHPEGRPAATAELAVRIGRCGTQIYLNRLRIAGPYLNLNVDVRYDWQVSSAKIRKVLEHTQGAHVPFVLGRGSRGVLASLGDKVLAGNKHNKRIVPLGKAEIPVELLHNALAGKPNITLEVGRFYATASAHKVMIFKQNDKGHFHGVFVETEAPGLWHENGQNLYQEHRLASDIVALWEDAENEIAQL